MSKVISLLNLMLKQYKTGHFVSREGIVFNKKGKNKHKKTYITKFGYECFSYGNTSYYVHRVVWETYNGDIPEGLCINHKNGIKTDNNLSNLEVATYKENYHHGMRLGLINPSQPAETNAQAKLNNQEYYDLIEKIMLGYSNDDIANFYNLHPRYVSLIRGKKRLLTIWQEYENNNGSCPIPISQNNSRFNLDQKLSIIKLLNTSTNKEIADKVHVDASVISRVRSRKTWKNAWEIYDNKVQRSSRNGVDSSESKRGAS